MRDEEYCQQIKEIIREEILKKVWPREFDNSMKHSFEYIECYNNEIVEVDLRGFLGEESEKPPKHILDKFQEIADVDDKGWIVKIWDETYYPEKRKD